MIYLAYSKPIVQLVNNVVIQGIKLRRLNSSLWKYLLDSLSVSFNDKSFRPIVGLYF